MSLISKIKTIVEASGYNFYYDSGGNLEEIVGNADFDNNKCVVFAFLLSNSTFEDGKEAANIGLFFSRLAKMDFDSMENDAIQDECKEDMFNFLQQVDSGNVLIYGSISMQRFYDMLAVNVTGVAINTIFAETSGLTTCIKQKWI